MNQNNKIMHETVLIIDDEKKLCGLLARIIGLEGFTVFQAFTGKEGLKVLKDQDIK
jgi:two-component system NtrC family response regulator